MDERELIDRYFASRTVVRADVRLGIGDDAAVTTLATGRDLVTATDSIFEGTHFPPGTPASSVGHRVLAVNLSDLAAMGAEPLWFTLALSLPAVDPAWLEEFAGGLLRLADGFRTSLIGGDTVRGPLSATVTALGHVRPGAYRSRGGARPGDGIWVTGTPGDSVAGRELLAAGEGLPQGAVEVLRRRFLYPTPRVREGIDLAPLASAMIDVSDGLHDDIGKLLRASGAGAELSVDSLPLSPALRICRPDDAIHCALTGGDDYELCFTLPPEREPELARLAAGWDLPVTRLGTVTGEERIGWQRAGKEFPVPDTTYQHF